MIEEIYEIKAKITDNLKEQKLVDDYGRRLKELKKRMDDKFPVLDIIKFNKIEDMEIIKLNNEISDIETKYNNSKKDYKNKYTNNNSNLISNLEKFQKNQKLEKEIKKIITKIESGKNLVLNSELINMKRVMRRLDFVTKDETLTPKGHLICDISGADELVTAELLFSGFFKDMTLEEIGASIYCCLSKENVGKKDENESLNMDFNAQKKMKKIFEDILNKVNYIADILEECRIFNEDGKQKYIESFNDIYMMPIYKWISGAKFSDLMKEFYKLYEGSLIRIIRRVEEFTKNFETSVEHIGDNNLKKKLGEMQEKIKRDLPFASSLYLESN
jgi:ATP-dependent RNA helicase DOB1